MSYESKIISLINKYDREKVIEILCNSPKNKIDFFNEFKTKGEFYFGGSTVVHVYKYELEYEITFDEWVDDIIDEVIKNRIKKNEEQIKEIRQIRYVHDILKLLFG